MVFTEGKVFDQSSFQDHVRHNSDVVKYGGETEYTRGVFDMQGTCVKRLDYSDTFKKRSIILNNQIVVLSAGDPDTNPFAKEGDSGALVFAKHKGKWFDLRGVGIVEGGTSNKTVVVTPLWDVFTYLNRSAEDGLKKFTMPLLRIDSGYVSPNGNLALQLNSPESPRCEDDNEQARSQELAEHFREIKEKQTREFKSFEERINSRLEKLEEQQQRDHQEKNEQAQNHQRALEEQMQNQQRVLEEKMQNQQAALEDKMKNQQTTLENKIQNQQTSLENKMDNMMEKLISLLSKK